jgi:hypothetical protein
MINPKSLSPGEKDARMANLAKDRKFYRYTAGLLQKALESSKEFRESHSSAYLI